jgi:two-component system OmpR family response regulator
MSDTKRILVVDDDPDFRLTIETILKGVGYDVLTAFNGAEGEAMAAEHEPDLIVLDIMMEEVDAGLVVAERLGNQYPVVLLSSIADSTVKVFDADKLPVKGILQKPIRADALLQTVRKALEA